MANHKLSTDTTQDPCKVTLDSTFKSRLPVTSCIVDSAAIYAMVVKFRNTICPPQPQLSLHRRAALSSNSNGTRSYIAERTQSAAYIVRCLWFKPVSIPSQTFYCYHCFGIRDACNISLRCQLCGIERTYYVVSWGIK
jgi:hypothetical protein